MKKFIKLLNIIILVMCFTLVISCNKDSNDESAEIKNINELVIYTVNDFHGSLESTDGEYGAARIAGYIKGNSIKEETAYLTISAGDMFQGSGISNYTKGLSVVNVMNEIGFDAMTLGNHEFDWNLNTVLAYRDGNIENGEANFPFLGCNIIDKTSSSIPNFVDPYTIVEKDGVKIGIIGYMGYGLEEDIATQMIENYEFIEPVACVKEYAQKLRVDEKCHVVIAVGHDGDSTTNLKISKLDGDSKVDAIINGHTHSSYTDEYRRNDGVKIPCIQSGTAGNYVGVVTLSLNEETKAVTGGVAYNKMMNSKVTEDETVLSMVNQIVEETAHIFKRELCETGATITHNMGCKWAASSLQEYMKTDVAFINTGGIRRSAFPIDENSVVDVSKVFEIMPFDNTIKTVKLKGSVIIRLFDNGDLCYSQNVTKGTNSEYLINGNIIEEDKLYTVACVDYIFDQSSYPFLSGEDIFASGILFRDILIETLEKIGDRDSKWVG